MNSGVVVESGLSMTPGRDMMAVAVPDSLTSPWDQENTVPSSTGSGVGSSNNSGRGGGLTVTKLLARPKTSSSVRQLQLQQQQQQQQQNYVVGSRCSIQVLGEGYGYGSPQPLMHTQSQPLFHDRPRTSTLRVTADRGDRAGRTTPTLRERPGTSSSKERRTSGGLGVSSGKEIPLPVCTTLEIRSPGPDRQLLSISSKLRHRSGVGPRGMASLLGPTSRDRSAALLKELSLSFGVTPSSTRVGPTSPFKDCLREKWSHLSREPSYSEMPGGGGIDDDGSASSETYILVNGAKESPDTSPSPTAENHRHHQQRKASTPAGSDVVDGRSERFRTLSFFREHLQDTWRPSEVARADSVDLSDRSASSNRGQRSSRPSTVKRSRSSPSVPVSEVAASAAASNAGVIDSGRSSKNEKALTTPRIITINRVPSATGEKKRRKKKRMASATPPSNRDVNMVPNHRDVSTPIGEERLKPVSVVRSLSVSSTNTISTTTTSTTALTLPLSRSRGLGVPTEAVLASAFCIELGSTERLTNKSPLPGDIPGNVTTFEMDITPVHVASTLPSPRSRTVSQVSDLHRPVSVKDDVTLLHYSLDGQSEQAGDPKDVHRDGLESAVRGRLSPDKKRCDLPAKLHDHPELPTHGVEVTHQVSSDSVNERTRHDSLTHSRKPSHDKVKEAIKGGVHRAASEEEVEDDHQQGAPPTRPSRTITQEELTAIMKAKPDDFLHYFEEAGVLVEQSNALVHGLVHLADKTYHSRGEHVDTHVKSHEELKVRERKHAEDAVDIPLQSLDFRTSVGQGHSQHDPGHFVVTQFTENGHKDLELNVPVAVECSDGSNSDR